MNELIKETVVTPATGDVMTLQELKAILHIDYVEDDGPLTMYLAGVVEYMENVLNRNFLETEWDWFIDGGFPANGGELRPPRSPMMSVTSVSYVDTAGATQVLTVDDDYVVDTSQEPGRIRLPYGAYWPAARYIESAVTVRYKAGYATAAEIPVRQKVLISKMVEGLSTQRGVSEPIEERMNKMFSMLLASEQVYAF